MGSSRYLPKIENFDAGKFWNSSYAEGRAKLLRLVKVDEEKISDLISTKYTQLPSELRYDLETSDIVREKL